MLRRLSYNSIKNMQSRFETTSATSKSYNVVSNLTEVDENQKIPFARAKIGPFFQEQASVGNQFIEDVTLRNYLKRWMPTQVLKEITPDLEQFGHRVATDIWQLHLECDRNLPKLEQYNAWGKRVDKLITCESWKKMKTISAKEGLIAIGYERKYGQWSRLYQIAKLYMYAPSAGLYSCPLAMTDGAARSLEVTGDAGLMSHAYPRLTSRDPDVFWTSGQWMTERRGGSDVARGTETIAIEQADSTYKLYGYKWFTSANDSNMTLTLARIADRDGRVKEGTRGLSMFYVELRDSEDNLNGIQVQRLKDKLGTRQVPTAELLLDGTRAIRVSNEGHGVASISHMLLMTRIHNTIGSAGCMRRITNLARDFSRKRECFGQAISNYPLHVQNLANMEVEARGSLLLLLELARLLGSEECNKATEHEKQLLRLLTPIAKLYTAKQAVAVASEGLECFGGLGYLEDTGLPSMLRDAQVLPIWEGTTNILSLDVLRALSKSKGSALLAFNEDVQKRLAAAKIPTELQPNFAKIKAASNEIVAFAAGNGDILEPAARDFAFSLARTYIGMLLLEHASWEGATKQDQLAAIKWCNKDLVPAITELNNGTFKHSTKKTEYDLVFDGYQGPLTGSSKL